MICKSLKKILFFCKSLGEQKLFCKIIKMLEIVSLVYVIINSTYQYLYYLYYVVPHIQWNLILNCMFGDEVDIWANGLSEFLKCFNMTESHQYQLTTIRTSTIRERSFCENKIVLNSEFFLSYLKLQRQTLTKV